jgi:hypothetical protein
MIISPNRRFAFVHLHKCAGTSIELALEPFLGVNDLQLGSTGSGEAHHKVLRQVTGLYKHSTALQMREAVGEERWNAWFTFAFVRHPVERLRSLYAYHQTLIARKPMTESETVAFRESGKLPPRPPYRFPCSRAVLETTDFNGFVLHPATWKDAGSQPLQHSLCDESGKLLVKFVGKVERLEADWAQVQQRLKVDASVGRHNASLPLKDAQMAFLSEEARARLRQRYQQDCELLGYQLEGAE